ncbi:MAG: response regulator [Acidobacteria bacterium]|nr:response regulator [Acidobacteriota bacterium]
MRTVLLVEDNENNRYLFTLLLTHAGFKVLTAVNGREGLEKARADKPDAILLDIQMGEMDGYEVAEHLKVDPVLASIPIIGVSSFAMPGDRSRALSAGFAGYIEKPVDPEFFAATVQQLLHEAK